MTQASPDPLATSGLVVVDKPAGMTSHDVIGRLRRIFHTRRVGHAGTLDPLATGVLIVGINRGTKFLTHLVAATKSYQATIRLGMATTTDDAEGAEISRADTTHLTDDDIAAALSQFIGRIMQRPAAVSAIKIDGKRAHERVRAGESITIPAREVTISQLTPTGFDHHDEFVDMNVTVHCSSGTYIRSIARDLGEALHVGGHITALRRTAVGNFTLADTRTLTQLETDPHLSLSLDQALTRCYPTLAITEAEATALSLGQWLPARGLGGTHAAVSPDGRSIALVKETGNRLATVFVARPATLT